jgi:hypothetical protein
MLSPNSRNASRLPLCAGACTFHTLQTPRNPAKFFAKKSLDIPGPLVSKLQGQHCSQLWGADWKCQVLNWTSDNAKAVNPASVSQVSVNPVSVNPVSLNPVPLLDPKRKRSALPVLLVLFLFSWGLMASLIVEQGRTIESQRWLIQSLFQDSSKLSQMKGQAFQKQYAEAQAQAKAKAHSQLQAPSTHDKSQDQAKPNQARQDQAKNQAAGKVHKRIPQQPPTDADTLADERRTVLRI